MSMKGKLIQLLAEQAAMAVFYANRERATGVHARAAFEAEARYIAGMYIATINALAGVSPE